MFTSRRVSNADSVVNFVGKGLTDVKVGKFIKGLQNKQMNVLNLNCNKITDEGFMKILVTLCSHPTLHKVELQNNLLSEKSLLVLKQHCPVLKALKVFDFRYNNFSPVNL